MPENHATHRLARRRPSRRSYRINDEDAWEAYRANVLGLPSAFDIQLSRSIREAMSVDRDKYPSVEDVRCTLWVERIPGEQEDIFVDPDTFNLYITAHVSPELVVSTQQRTSPAAIYMEFRGRGTEMEAPEWTTWTPGTREQRVLDDGRRLTGGARCERSRDRGPRTKPGSRRKNADEDEEANPKKEHEGRGMRCDGVVWRDKRRVG
ncbi:hypothetical protein EIP86_010160 [Pleurotus ostreatoroseus]|nr:hypothetical protein EIP86_010160 [Pleurotus ostreatoroseus]